MTLEEQIKALKPGTNYPARVLVREKPVGEHAPLQFEFLLQSYFVGMYCAIHTNGSRIPHQVGDHDNKRFVRGLKKDLLKAVARGATVELGSLRPVKTEP